MRSLDFFLLSLLGAAPLTVASITCLQVGSTATAQWKNAQGAICTYTGTVGSNFGKNGLGNDYGCQGRCGVSCNGIALGNAYTQHCYNHDICSYFSNASGGDDDINCGEAFKIASEDFKFGSIRGCGQKNPTLGVTPPTRKPHCVYQDLNTKGEDGKGPQGSLMKWTGKAGMGFTPNGTTKRSVPL